MRTSKWMLVGASAVLFAPGAWATNGYLALGYGPVSVGLAGSCVAITDSAMCAANNPAVISGMDNRWELGLDFFMPYRGYKADNNGWPPPFPSIPAGKEDSENNLFLIPSFAYTQKLDAVSSLGVIVGGQGGMNTEYSTATFRNFNNPGGQATSPTGIDMAQLFVGIDYSRRIEKDHSLAIMPVFAVQYLSATGLRPFKPWSASPENVSNNGKDWSYGAGVRFGWLWDATPELKIGASYQTKLWMTRFKDYEGLLADNGDFDVPPILDLGFSYRFHPQWRFSFNYQRIWYDNIKSIGNAADLQFPFPPAPVLGTEDGLGFGWNNMNVYKFGLSYDYDADWTFRAGFSHASKAFDNEQALFNMLAPAVVRNHYTLGVGKKFSKDSELNLALMYAPEEKVHGTNPNTGPQTGYLYMDQWQIGIGWTAKF